jgi:hypothetical protein
MLQYVETQELPGSSLQGSANVALRDSQHKGLLSRIRVIKERAGADGLATVEQTRRAGIAQISLTNVVIGLTKCCMWLNQMLLSADQFCDRLNQSCTALMRCRLGQ